MKTLLYLLRHAATPANLSHPAKLQGRRHDPPLAAVGVRQAEMTRDFLAVRAIDACYCSPMRRAQQTAGIIAEPHALRLENIEDLTECDVGRWEGIDWDTIRCQDPERYNAFHANPARFGYPGGESFADVYDRAAPAIDRLLELHEGGAILVVTHHIVGRTYLAGVLGLGPDRARQISLDNCGISLVQCQGGRKTLATLNATFPLQGLAW
jgi:broad specificity phosphatase PhoE